MTPNYLISVLASATLLSFTPAMAATQNEISGGISHNRIYDANVTSVGYTRYMSELDSADGALAINPYLQRVSDVSVAYTDNDRVDFYDISGRWYINSDWMASAQYRYYDTVPGRSQEEARVQLGYNLNPHWQIGGGVAYHGTEYRSRLDPGYSYSDDDTDPTLFTRYTKVSGGKGWDVLLESRFGEGTYVAATARYFFNKGLSAEVRTGDIGDSSFFQLATEYWQTEQFSLRAELGLNFDASDDTVQQLGLKARYRF